MATKTLLTIEQFDQLPIKEGILYELNEGEVVTMTEPRPRHNWVRDNIARLMGNFVEERKLGRVFLETGYQLSPDTVRIPDVSFVLADRMREIDLDRRIQGAPALAIEVVSPSERLSESHDKVRAYLRSGTTEVWQIYPKSRTVQIHRGETARSLEWSHPVETDLLPGFAMQLESLFA